MKKTIFKQNKSDPEFKLWFNILQHTHYNVTTNSWGQFLEYLRDKITDMRASQGT